MSSKVVPCRVARTVGSVADSMFELTTATTLTMLEALIRAMAARDAAVHQHAQRVQRYALALAAELGIDDEWVIGAIEMAALLHDVGKLAIPDRVLVKPGPLTPEEFEEVKQHVVIGAELLASVPYPGPLAAIVRHHHEKWNGGGYPDGLAGEEIPLGARVLAVADSYDALTSDRPYRAALTHQEALAIIEQGHGTTFDPEIAETFLQMARRVEEAHSPQAAAERPGWSPTLWVPEVRVV